MQTHYQIIIKFFVYLAVFSVVTMYVKWDLLSGAGRHPRADQQCFCEFLENVPQSLNNNSLARRSRLCPSIHQAKNTALGNGRRIGLHKAARLNACDLMTRAFIKCKFTFMGRTAAHYTNKLNAKCEYAPNDYYFYLKSEASRMECGYLFP